MNGCNKAFTAVSMVALAMSAGSAIGSTVTVSDGDFIDSNWSETDFGNGTVFAVQDTSVGNPGSSRSVYNSTFSGFTRGFHKNLDTGATISPATVGGIAGIDFSIDAKWDSGVGLNGHQVGMALMQAGIAFRSSVTQSVGHSAEWVTRTASYTAADFVRFDGLPGTVDFSAGGSPITVGFQTGINGASFTHNYVWYDNYEVVIHAVPAPGSIGLAGLGMLFMARRLRRGE
jgi:hypothetical protein